MDLYKELFRNGAFRIGFYASAFVFFVANLIPHPREIPTIIFGCPDCIDEMGFPFLNHKITVDNALHEDFFHLGLIADVLIGVFFCFAAGLLFKYVSSRMDFAQKQS